jgi:hypothetical protein
MSGGHVSIRCFRSPVAVRGAAIAKAPAAAMENVVARGIGAMTGAAINAGRKLKTVDNVRDIRPEA